MRRLVDAESFSLLNAGWSVALPAVGEGLACPFTVGDFVAITNGVDVVIARTKRVFRVESIEDARGNAKCFELINRLMYCEELWETIKVYLVTLEPEDMEEPWAYLG